MTDEEFLGNEQRYYAHMKRFIDAHKDAPRGDILIELERHDRWVACMGLAADVLEPPSRSTIEARP